MPCHSLKLGFGVLSRVLIRVCMPAAHALVQAAEDLERAASDLTVEELWGRPRGAASVGFHLRHIAGSTDRLLTYARGERLTECQREVVALETEPGEPPTDKVMSTAGATQAGGGATVR